MLEALTLDGLKSILKHLHYRYGDKPPSDDFCGLYFHGRTTPFTLKEHEVPILTFRYFSEFSYPIYLFYNEDSGGEINELLEMFDNIRVVPISPMLSIRDYDKFVMFEMFSKVLQKHNRTLTFHSDGFLLSQGWERFVLDHDFDYLGAPWCLSVQDTAPVVVPGADNKYPVKQPIAVGNGGFCLRKRDKCLRVVDAVDPRDLNWLYTGFNLPDDVFFSYFGFGLGIFKSYDISLARRWSQEPLRSFDSYGFHKTYRQFQEDIVRDHNDRSNQVHTI